ncbi:hypothetical protein AB6A40_008214 [Gnathostoma spinigerum]|uniref:Uncharacterized protein n=1 Tax=Gnathostoma spinigerum TaxID=75299 RepID=A0ABD6EPP5_9BILA
MAVIREHQRVQLWILILAGVFHTFDQWRRTLLPFLQWHIKPQPTFYSIGVLNSVGHFATLFGTPFAAQLIDSNGCWESALILSLITAIHAIMVSEVTDFYIFGFLQCLLAANQLPLLFDTMIGQSVADDESDKMRAQLLMQLTIPQSIAYAAGPYFAIQVIFFFTSNLSASMIGASLSFFILTALIIYFVIPRNKFTRGPQHSYLPSITAYTEMLSNQNLRWSLLFLIFVAAPYACYEQVIRVALPVHHIFEPSSFLKLVSTIFK